MFVFAQVLGLFVGSRLTMLGIAIVGHPEKISSSLYIFLYVLGATAAILLLLRYFRHEKLLKAMEATVIFTASLIVFSFILPKLAFFLAIALTVVRLYKRNIITLDISMVIGTAGVGAILGASLGIIPALVLLVVLAIYDYVAVFHTKHMVYLAEELKSTPFSIIMPRGEEGVQLGAGDVALPTAFAVSTLATYGWFPAISAVTGAFIGFAVLFHYGVMGGERRPLPGLPLICAGAIGGFLFALVI